MAGKVLSLSLSLSHVGPHPIHPTQPQDLTVSFYLIKVNTSLPTAPFTVVTHSSPWGPWSCASCSGPPCEKQDFSALLQGRELGERGVQVWASHCVPAACPRTASLTWAPASSPRPCPHWLDPSSGWGKWGPVELAGGLGEGKELPWCQLKGPTLGSWRQPLQAVLLCQCCTTRWRALT